MIELYAFLTSLGFWQWFAVLLVVKWTLQFPSSIIRAFSAHKVLSCNWPKEDDSEDIELSRKGETTYDATDFDPKKYSPLV